MHKQIANMYSEAEKLAFVKGIFSRDLDYSQISLIFSCSLHSKQRKLFY